MAQEYDYRIVRAIQSTFSFPKNKNGKARARELTTFMKDLVRERNLDLRKTYRDMPDEKAIMEKAVKDKFPHLFINQNAKIAQTRIRLLHTYMSKKHSDRRYNRTRRRTAGQARGRRKAATSSRDTLQESSPPLALTTTQPTDTEPIQVYSRNTFTISVTAEDGSRGTLIIRKKLGLYGPVHSESQVPMHRESTPVNEAPVSNNIMVGTREAFSVETEAVSSSPAPRRLRSHLKHSTSSQDSSAEGVEHFLATCNPPLIRYFPNLMAAGCINKQCIMTVSKLKEDALENYVQSLAQGGVDSPPMTSHEKAALKNWFTEYFHGIE